MAGYLCPMPNGIFFANDLYLIHLARCLWHHFIAHLLNGILSNNIRILSPNKGHQNERKSHSVEKTSIFEVFPKMLIDRWLRGYLFVIVWFTKHRIAKGKVSSRERPCFVVRKVMFQATKHKLWRGQSLPFAHRKLTFRKMRDEG